MSKVNFTAGRIENFKCQPGKSQSFLWDASAPGLGLRVTAFNAKSYIFQGKLNGKTMRITIGATATWEIGAAQSETRRLKMLLDNGLDPRQVKADAQAVNKAKVEASLAQEEARQIQILHETLSLAEVWPIYIKARQKRWSEWHKRDHENVVRTGGITKIRGKGVTEPGPLASLLPVPLTHLTGARLGEWLAKEVAIRPTQAALAFRLLSVFVNWCDSQPEYAGLIPARACKSSQVRDELPSRNAKEGDSLQREQLVSWFAAVREMANPVQSAYLQSLLLTGARRRELAALCWDDIDFQWLKMTIRDKVEGERVIPLTPYVSHLLSALPRRNEWVFSSPAAKDGRLVEPTPGHKRALIAAGLPDLTLHGLRRSFGSLAEWTETPTGIVAQIMGHKPSAIAEKHYRRRPLDLLRKWHVKIEEWLLNEADVNFVAPKSQLRLVNEG